MLRYQVLLVLVSVASLACAGSARAEISVDSWVLDCVILAPGGQGSSAFFTMVQPDFAEEHEAELGISSAFASYMISYDANSFDFRSTVSLAAQGSPPLLFSACEGVIRVTTDEPLLLSAESSFTYSLPSGHRRATYILTAGADGTAYISGFGGADTGFGDPPVGTVEVDDGPILVPGNTTYLLRYTMSLDSLGGDPTVLSQGDGHVHFRLESVPEPMTAGLLMAAVPLVLRRRRRHS